MNDKQTNLINEFLSHVNKDYHNMFLELAEYAITLGYTPVKNKTQDFSIDFRNNKFKKTIMKMEEKEQRHDTFKYGEREIPGLRLRFFANKEYSDIFKNGIKRVIEEFDGKYVGCYGCGRCNGAPQGYTYTYPNGKKVFRCGTELISIFDFTEKDIKEIKSLMKCQDEYYMKTYSNMKLIN